MSTAYADFIAAKLQRTDGHGFEPNTMPSHLFDFQAELVQWAIRQGRAAIFADCGMGKTPMELAWAENVHRHTGKPVLLLTPLAVGFQVVQEAEKFGHEAAQSRTGKPTAAITVSNYEQAAKFDPTDFGRHAEPDQWELADTYITAAATFLDAARTAREETADADV